VFSRGLVTSERDRGAPFAIGERPDSRPPSRPHTPGGSAGPIRIRCERHTVAVGLPGGRRGGTPRGYVVATNFLMLVACSFVNVRVCRLNKQRCFLETFIDVSCH